MYMIVQQFFSRLTCYREGQEPEQGSAEFGLSYSSRVSNVGEVSAFLANWAIHLPSNHRRRVVTA
jgi:hypothetical protein